MFRNKYADLIAKALAPKPKACGECGAVIRQPSTGRQRCYCSGKCRQKAWRDRRVTNPIDSIAERDNLQSSRTDHPTGEPDTGPRLRPKPRRGAL